MIAKIAVASAIYAIDKPYSYNVPSEMKISSGVRVIVPFGRGNKRTEGIVLDIEDTVRTGLKSIEQVLDDEPILDAGHIRMAAFLRERYFCTFYDAMKAMLPAGLWFHAEESYIRTEKDASRAKLNGEEAQILTYIGEIGGRVSHCDLARFYPPEILDAALENLLRKKYLSSNQHFSRNIKDKTEIHVSLSAPVEEALAYAQKHQRSASVQSDLLRLLCTVGEGSAKELCYLTGATLKTIHRLEGLGYVTCREREVLRSPLPVCIEPAAPVILNEEQKLAFDRLCEQSKCDKPGVSLLYGVTGSGKTSVYIRLIREMLNNGKGSLLLVPEIALTPQLISLLMSHFGNTVAVLHSALRVTERYDGWKKIRQGGAQVVVGTRSAVFAPIPNLGLLIVDEEQEHTYKSENTPRYHAKEVAIYRGNRENALVVLGSATPSVESMYLAKEGIYSLNKLEQRYNRKPLPAVDIVDMKEEIRRGNNTGLSTPLKDALRRCFAAQKQAILFLNRRGAGRCIVCVDCGDVRQCPRCSVSLTYHKANNRLMCHHCGYSEPVYDRCDKCGGHVKVIGTGTQKIQQELEMAFPGVETIRMDADTLTSVNGHESILKHFDEDKIPVLIGTQMVTKGLNFENVTLVGIVDADMSLYVNHYRAAETTFSMLTQVIGRSGRGAYAGKAIIQTMTPQHSVLRLAAEQDYDAFYDLETTLRMMQKTPPFGDVFTVMFISQSEEAAMRGAYDFRSMLAPYRDKYCLEILGPSTAAIAKVNNSYRYKLTICCKNNKDIRMLLCAALKEFGKNKKYKGVSAYADINSYE